MTNDEIYQKRSSFNPFWRTHGPVHAHDVEDIDYTKTSAWTNRIYSKETQSGTAKEGGYVFRFVAQIPLLPEALVASGRDHPDAGEIVPVRPGGCVYFTTTLN